MTTNRVEADQRNADGLFERGKDETPAKYQEFLDIFAKESEAVQNMPSGSSATSASTTAQPRK